MNRTRPPMNRMHFIDQQIRSNSYPNCTTLSRDYEVSIKTIQRDIEYMRTMMDAPIEYDSRKRGYYYTDKTYFLPLIAFTDQDTVSFVLNQRILSQYRDTPIYNDIKQVLDKVMQFLPDNNEIEARTNYLSFQNEPASPVEHEKFKLLQTAIRNEQQVILRYYAPSSDEQTERTVNPYNIHNHDGCWYLVAFCLKRNDFRFFALNRILSVELTDEEFYKHDNFDIEQVLGDSFNIIRGGEIHHVKIHFSSYQARWIRERQWHKSQQLIDLKDGGLILHMDVQGLDDVKRWVLQYGAEVEVLEPAELRNSIRAELRKMYYQYTGTMIIDEP